MQFKRQQEGLKVNKKGFFRYISSKSKVRESEGVLLNEEVAPVADDAEKAELPNAFFASIFTAKNSPQVSQTLKR